MKTVAQGDGEQRNRGTPPMSDSTTKIPVTKLRYHLFAAVDYQERGGIHDYIDSFDSLEAAQVRFGEGWNMRHNAGETNHPYDWGHIVIEREGRLIPIAFCPRYNNIGHVIAREWIME